MELAPYICAVLPEWIDYNGHMSEAFYVLAFGDATTHVMEQLNMGETYRAETNCSLYTVEAHIRYLDEASLGQQLQISTVIAGYGAKKLHLCHEMHRDGELIATEEIMALHVIQEASGAVAFPEQIARIITLHGKTRPEWSGRSISS